MKNVYHHLQEIKQPAELLSARRLVEEMVETECHFKENWISANGWTVVPVESCDHFCPKDIEQMAAALGEDVLLECLAVATEELENVPIAYKLAFSRDALVDFNQATSLFFFVIFPVDRSWAILCSKHDYYLVGGNVSFVAKVLGTSIIEARARFRSFAENQSHPIERVGLCGVANRYEPASNGPEV